MSLLIVLFIRNDKSPILSTAQIQIEKDKPFCIKFKLEPKDKVRQYPLAQGLLHSVFSSSSSVRVVSFPFADMNFMIYLYVQLFYVAGKKREDIVLQRYAKEPDSTRNAFYEHNHVL